MGRVDESGWKDLAVMADEDESFLPRWSSRKLGERNVGVNTGAESESSALERAQEDEAEAVAAQPLQELTDADMPPVDTLDEHSDYTAFMSPRVSDRLRAQALRRLFHLPAYNITDGLNDYDEDYTRFTGLGNIVTHEMKRMLKRELEESEVTGELSEQETVMSDPDTTETDDTHAGVIDATADNDEGSSGVSSLRGTK